MKTGTTKFWLLLARYCSRPQRPSRACCISSAQKMTRPWLLISLFHLTKCVNRANAILFSHFGSTEGDQTTSVRSFWKKEDCWGMGHWRGKVQEFRILPPGKTEVCTLISTFLWIPCHKLYLHLFSSFIFFARVHVSLVQWLGRNVQHLQKNMQLWLENRR